jgi:hypothetical protein
MKSVVDLSNTNMLGKNLLFTFFTTVHVITLQFISREKCSQAVLECDQGSPEPAESGGE